MYEYEAWLVPSTHDPYGVVDGDTMHVCVDLGMDVAILQTLRVYGINAPELSTDAGKTAKQWTINWFQTNVGFNATTGESNHFKIQTVKDQKEKYGRYLATIIAASGENFNVDIVNAGMAVPYFP